MPVLFCGLLELVLRVCGYGYPTEFFLPHEIDGRAVYVDNQHFGRRFFPPQLNRIPDPCVLPAVKPAGTYRIFVLGESAALGFPDSSFSFARILDVMLRHRYPGLRFEVINTAMTAINSNVILPIARDCCRRQPDLLIVYAGNNEVVGPFGTAGVLGPYSPSLRLIRANLAARSTRTGQLLADLALPLRPRDPGPHTWGGMAMFLHNEVRADDGRLHAVHDHFRRNLEDLCSAAHDGGAGVLVCTVGTNLRDCPPFASAHRPGFTDAEQAAWTAVYGEGVRAEAAGKYEEAVTLYRKAADLDDGYADLAFRLGRCLAALGRHAEAREQYLRARDLDTLHFRSDTRINDIIRAVAADGDGVTLADVEQAFADHSPGGAPGDDLFYEHVHMNFTGNYLAARTILDRLAGHLPAAGGAVLPTEQECRDRLAFTDWNRYMALYAVASLLKQAPFTNQIGNEERSRRLDEEVEKLKVIARASLARDLTAYQRALNRAEGDWVLRKNYAALLRVCRQPARAAEQAAVVLGQLPHRAEAHYDLGVYLADQGRFDEAAAQYREALRRRPDFAEAHANLGMILANQGLLEEALGRYTEALRINPDLALAHANRAGVLARLGRTDEAAAEYLQAIGLLPENAEAHYHLGDVLEGQGKETDALSHYREALRLRPGWSLPAQRLERLSRKAGE